MKIGLLGYGTVGGGVDKIIRSKTKEVASLEVTKILSLNKVEGDTRFVSSIEEIVGDPEIDLVVECIGGIDPAAKYITAALENKKHVVTSNKAVVSKYFFEFVNTAMLNNVGLYLEATAGGGVPWIHNLIRTKRIDEISDFYGIINGTSNFIIDKMEKENADFDETLKLAQEKGYAEADPSADIDGDDVRAKSMISASIAFDTLCTDKIPTSGIRNLSASDIEVFREMNLNVRMVVRAKRTDNKYCVCVEPQLCVDTSLEANTPGYFNTVSLTGKTVGELKFFGAGAGEFPTANAIIQDILDCVSGYVPEYSFDSDLEFDTTIMPSTYLYRTKAEHALPRNSIMIRKGYFEVGGKYPDEANQYLSDMLVEDPNTFMASMQRVI